jgi:hypothetical protein
MCDDALLRARILTLPHYISHLENSLRGVQMSVKAVPNINMSLDWSRVALVVKVARAERTADHFSRVCHSEFTATPPYCTRPRRDAPGPALPSDGLAKCPSVTQGRSGIDFSPGTGPPSLAQKRTS